jgi:hypothetical protein
LNRPTTPDMFASRQYRDMKVEARAEVAEDREHQAVMRKVRRSIEQAKEVLRVKRAVNEQIEPD